MSDAEKPSNVATQPTSAELPQTNPWQCLGGSVVAGGIAFAMYLLTNSIAQFFATKGVHSTNQLVQRLSAAVRTLIIGLSTLGTGIFALAALGLLGLGIQLLIQRSRRP
jgi:Na+/H+ antiporter NhaA